MTDQEARIEALSLRLQAVEHEVFKHQETLKTFRLDGQKMDARDIAERTHPEDFATD